MPRRFGWRSGTLKCQDVEVLNNVTIQNDLVFSDVSAGVLGVTGGIDMTGTTSAVGINMSGGTFSTASIRIGDDDNLNFGAGDDISFEYDEDGTNDLRATTAAGQGTGFIFTGGTGTSTGAGGGFAVTAGAGGSSSGTGGAVDITAGAGTDGNAVGGAVTLTAGAGEATAGSSGDGGAVAFVGGAAGTSTGTGAGGAVTLTTGAGGTTSGLSGVITLTTGNVANATSGTASATGAITLTTGTAGTATTGTGGASGALALTGVVGGLASGAAGTGGAGSAINIVTGIGGATTDTAAGSETGGAGGTLTLTGGAGGAIDNLSTGTGGAGSSVNVTAGAGGAASASSSNGGVGGDIVLVAGVGGVSSSGTAGADGTIYLRPSAGMPPMVRVDTVTADTTDITITAAELLGQVLTIDDGAADTTWTLPPSADLDTALAGNADSDSFYFHLINLSAEAGRFATVTTNTGWTLIGNMQVIEADSADNTSSGTFLARRTGAGAWVCYRVG